jgi:LysR family hydrogen peroxide-inducible transcriptional activator
MTAHEFSLRQLQYVVAVADTGGFGRAAEQCHVSQPSLSVQVAQMEGALGVRLFERDRRRVLLTAAGERLLERARRVLAEADDLVREAGQSRDPFAGTLRIGVIGTISPYLLPAVVPALRREYPRLTLLWTEDKTAVLLRELSAGRLEGALLALVEGLDAFEHQRIAEDAFVLAARPGHPLVASRQAAKPRDLKGAEVLLLEDGHCFRDQALAFCARAGARESGFRATSLGTLVQVVAGGAGVTLLPSLALKVESRRGELAVRPFGAPPPARRIVLAWRRQSAVAPALRRIATSIAKAYPG